MAHQIQEGRQFSQDEQFPGQAIPLPSHFEFQSASDEQTENGSDRSSTGDGAEEDQDAILERPEQDDHAAEEPYHEDSIIESGAVNEYTLLGGKFHFLSPMSRPTIM